MYYNSLLKWMGIDYLNILLLQYESGKVNKHVSIGTHGKPLA